MGLEPHFIEIVALDKTGINNYALQIVETLELQEFLSHNLPNFIYLSDVKIMQKDLVHAALASQSFDHMRYTIQKNLHASFLNPIIAESDGVFRAGTFESLLALSAFYHFEKIRSFAEQQGLLQTEHNKRKLHVGIYGEIYATNSDLLPAVSHDNAAYVGSADVILLFLAGNKTGLPMSMNEGILAHEYHHRLFFNQLWVNNNSQTRWLRYQARYKPKKKIVQKRSQILLSATDEALADLFAIAYTGVTNFMAVSLTHEKTKIINDQRDLNGEFAKKATYEALALSILKPSLRKYCPAKSHNFTNAQFNIYCLATVIAKVFYEACDKDAKKLGSVALPLIHSVLPSIGRILDKNEPYDLELFFEEFARRSKNFDAVFHEKFCDQLKRRFVSLIINNRIPSCAGS
jgi:hypothetical protein